MTDARLSMKQVQLKAAQENFEQIFEDVLVSGGPLKILKETGNAILVSEEFWRGTTETLNLMSVPGMQSPYAPECVFLLRIQRQRWIGKMDLLSSNYSMESRDF